jgi:hypothetical protein
MDTSIEHTWDLTYFDQQNVGFSRNWDFIGISAMKLENDLDANTEDMWSVMAFAIQI